MNDQSKSAYKIISFILGLLLLNTGGLLIGLGTEKIFSKSDTGIYIGLGIALTITSFILQKTYNNLYILENKKADRDYRDAELKDVKLKEMTKNNMLKDAYDCLTKKINAGSEKYPKSLIKIIKKIA